MEEREPRTPIAGSAKVTGRWEGKKSFKEKSDKEEEAIEEEEKERQFVFVSPFDVQVPLL